MAYRRSANRRRSTARSYNPRRVRARGSVRARRPARRMQGGGRANTVRLVIHQAPADNFVTPGLRPGLMAVLKSPGDKPGRF